MGRPSAATNRPWWPPSPRSETEINAEHPSQPGQELGECQVEGAGDHLQIPDADFLFPVLQFRYEAAVYAGVFRHVNLCPPALSSQLPQSFSEPDTNITGHAPHDGCRLLPINRL